MKYFILVTIMTLTSISAQANTYFWYEGGNGKQCVVQYPDGSYHLVAASSCGGLNTHKIPPSFSAAAIKR